MADGERVIRWSGLQVRTTLFYMLTTLAAVLLTELLVGTAIWIALHYGGLADREMTTAATSTAHLYALEAAIKAGGSTLDPQITFEPGLPFSVALDDSPGINPSTEARYLPAAPSDHQMVTFALLISPDRQVLASSYTAQYPANAPVSQLIPDSTQSILRGLAGTATNGIALTPQGRVVWAVEPIWNRARQAVGTVYLQIPLSQEMGDGMQIPGFARIWIASSIFWLIIMLPVGALFGFITTRGLLKRLKNLATATTQFAVGDYDQRVQVSQRDEVGRLEAHFNRMAEQLQDSVARQRTLAGQNARLSERNRIARDLHDSVKQQLFAVSMQIGTALTVLHQRPEAARQHLQEADSLAYHAQSELTTLIQELHPLALQNKGLVSALEEYVIVWSRQRNIAVEFYLANTCVLSPLVEEALWHIAQECLSNIARHSRASKVQVSLTCEQDQVTLSITDNGQGFNPALAKQSGLRFMKERMEALGGTVAVLSDIGSGACVTAQCAHSCISTSDRAC